MLSLSLLSVHSILIAPTVLSLFFWTSPKTSDNQPPAPQPDHYTVHGNFSTPLDSPPYGVLKNDSDPDGDFLSCVFTAVNTSVGTALIFANGRVDFIAAPGKTGTVTVPYTVCDNHGVCADSTVTFEVLNQAPVANVDDYTFHRRFDSELVDPAPYGVLKNDSDPDGDALSCVAKQVDDPVGTANIFANGRVSFIPNHGQTGDVSITYTVCDNLGACSEGVVLFHVINEAPVAGNDSYVVRTKVFATPFETPWGVLKNDSDPEGDSLLLSFARVDFAQGTALVFATGQANFVRNDNYLAFSGSLSVEYTLCDDLGACSQGTATFLLIGMGENNGSGRCHESVGGPIKVSNGNMYLQQNDYHLPSIGQAISLSRTYNSDSQSVGLFGRGWSTQYDETIVSYDATLLSFTQSDGRAVYFTRPVTSSGDFADLIGDYHARVTQGGGGSLLSLKGGGAKQFNSAGKLVSQADRNGNTTTLAYDNNGFLSSVTDPFGRVLTFHTNSNGQVNSISDSLGTIATYAYGGSNELLSVTYADNSAFNFAYDGNLRLTTVTDALGNILESHSYDEQGRAITSEKHGGVDHFSVEYVSDTETDVTDGLGRVTKYTFDKSKGRHVVTRVEGVCSCGGGSQVQTWEYDDHLNVTSMTDALNHVTSYTYDADGNQLTETDPTGTVTYTYNAFSEVLTLTNQLGGLTTQTYDGAGNLLTTTNALGKTTSLSYDGRGLPRTLTDARNKTATFTYDAAGNLITRTDALNHSTQFAYDARGRLTSTTNALGHSTTFGYDAVGRVNLVTRADGTTTSFEYDLAGRRIAITDAKGNRSTYTYDAAYRLSSQSDTLNQTISYGYDVMSNLTSVTDALLRATNYEYDEFNRLVKTTYPAVTPGAARLFETVTYDGGGNLAQRTDTAGRVTSYAYDEMNRVVNVTDADHKTTSFEYDPLSRMTALVDAIGQRYRFNYDAVGRLRKMHRGPDVMSFTYDPVGNRKTRTDYNGAVTEYSYDAVNRLKTISYPDTATVSYTYDKLSRLQTATNENGVVNFDYNKMNRLTTVTDVFGQVVDYNYDANGNRTKVSLNSAILETYKYDAINRLTKILDAAGAAFTFDYDATNRLTQKKAPNGIKTSYQFDGLNRLTRLLDTKGANTIADRQYQYNTASQITQVAEPLITRSYGYDLVDRLTTASYTSPAQPNESYSYDGVGNRTASPAVSYNYQRFNRLANTATTSYSYDQNGNLISKTDSTGTTQYAWDFENRLRNVTLPNGLTVSYKYDALGRRIQRTPSVGVSTNFVYDGQDVVKDINSDGSTVEYLNGLGVDNKLRLTDSRMSGPLYFVHDHLGSTTGLTNATGGVVSQISYDSYGNANTSSSLTRYTYTGREFDSDTGLYYYRARWYDAKVGRFISEDPIGFGGGVNQFGYVGNNPQNRVDPSGLYEIDVHYYLTYFLAMKTGCFKDWVAHDIANEDQGTDENPDTLPAAGTTDKQRMQNRIYHGLTPGSAAGVGSSLLWQGALNETNGNVWIGRYLHHYQDSYSHDGYTNDVWGHSPLNALLGGSYGDHAVDKTATDPAKAMRMAGGTWIALVKYAKAKGCTCNPKWTDEMSGQIWDFINVGTSYPRTSTIDAIGGTLDNPGLGDPDALMRKRRILGLPDRYSGQW